jgi:hypothetical protein
MITDVAPPRLLSLSVVTMVIMGGIQRPYGTHLLHGALIGPDQGTTYARKRYETAERYLSRTLQSKSIEPRCVVGAIFAFPVIDKSVIILACQVSRRTLVTSSGSIYDVIAIFLPVRPIRIQPHKVCPTPCTLPSLSNKDKTGVLGFVSLSPAILPTTADLRTNMIKAAG